MQREDDGTFTGILGDHGYLKLIKVWGSDQGIVEAARMSTDKGFNGWGDGIIRCAKCYVRHDGQSDNLRVTPFLLGRTEQCAAGAHDFKPTTGDEKLLAHLWTNKHFTPFEMAGMQIEVEAPIIVFRQWHRHRSQSYDELSGRYSPLPDRMYIPTVERLLMVNGAGKNKQEQGIVKRTLVDTDAEQARDLMRDVMDASRRVYEALLDRGIAKEVARVVLPVGQYSRMRAQANLRMWAAFLDLRLHKDAQWEIRTYAQAVATLISEHFPRTYALWQGGGHV